MPLVLSGICEWVTFEIPSRTSKRHFTASAAVKTAGVTDEPGRCHSVRTLAMSKIVVKNRKTFKRTEGRNDFECSTGDKSPIVTIAARSSAAAAMVARVRTAAYRGSVHKTRSANLSKQSTTMVTYDSASACAAPTILGTDELDHPQH